MIPVIQQRPLFARCSRVPFAGAMAAASGALPVPARVGAMALRPATASRGTLKRSGKKPGSGLKTENRKHGLHHAQESGKAPHASLKYHSPLEGESERQGRSPQSIRRGAYAASRKSRSAALAEPQSETELLQRHALPQSCAGVCPPPHQPSPFGSASATPPQGGSDT